MEKKNGKHQHVFLLIYVPFPAGKKAKAGKLQNKYFLWVLFSVFLTENVSENKYHSDNINSVLRIKQEEKALVLNINLVIYLLSVAISQTRSRSESKNPGGFLLRVQISDFRRGYFDGIFTK